MRSLILATAVIFCGSLTFAQSKADIDRILKTYNTENSNILLNNIKQNEELKFQRINFFLQNNPNIKREFYSDGNHYEIIDIIDNKPIYFSTDNLLSSMAIRTRHLQPGNIPGTLGLNLQAEGMIIGVWDNGTALKSHVEFADDNGGSRVITPESSNPTTSYHATHVCGTVGAKGVVSGARGMAMKSTIKSYNWSADQSEVVNEVSNNALLVSNHSYGVPIYADSGALNVPGVWYMGCYSSDAVAWDQILYTYPYYLMVASAGNDGLTSYEGGLVGGLDKLTGNKNAKNNLVVANANPSVHPVNGNISSLFINPSSSQGPTDDGRIKPDIAADGTDLNSTSDESNNAYDSSSGTSMASPSVSGSLLLLHEHYHNLNGEYMLAATIKGLVCHTALDDPNTIGPDPRFGWGLMDSREAANVITNSSTSEPTALVDERILAQGGSYSFQVTVNSPKKLMATICWTDMPGTAQFNELNSSVPALVNDLDIRIIKNEEVHYPWKLDLSNLNEAIKGDNIVDNVERVDVDDAAGTYTIQVTHKGTLSGGFQNYSLIVSGFDNLPLSNTEFLRESITIYPNPATDVIYIDSDVHNFTKYELFDIQGRLIKTEKLSNLSHFEINVASFSKGIYMLNVTSESGSFTEKIIKR